MTHMTNHPLPPSTDSVTQINETVNSGVNRGPTRHTDRSYVFMKTHLQLNQNTYQTTLLQSLSWQGKCTDSGSKPPGGFHKEAQISTAERSAFDRDGRECATAITAAD